MASYADKVAEHERLAILRFLDDAPQYTSNVSMLKALLPDVGLPMDRARIIDTARWLEQAGLVTCEETGSLFLLTATTRGAEVAQGLLKIDGVARRRPGD